MTDCNHILNYEETHCTICLTPAWQIADESGIDKLNKLTDIVSGEVWRSKVTVKDINNFIEIIEENWKRLEKKIDEVKDILLKHIQLESSDPDLLNYPNIHCYNDDLLIKLKK